MEKSNIGTIVTLVTRLAVLILTIWVTVITTTALGNKAAISVLQGTVVSDKELSDMEIRLNDKINELGQDLKDCIYAVNNGQTCQ